MNTSNAEVVKADLYELLSMAFRTPTIELAELLSSGEYAAVLEEVLVECGFGSGVSSELGSVLSSYRELQPESLFHELRIGHTRLFVNAPKPIVSPYAGIWYAKEVGIDPVLFVNKESMAVERAMRACGIGRREGANDPLDHIATELEFLSYLCLVEAGAIDGSTCPGGAYGSFYVDRFIWWVGKFADALLGNTRQSLFAVSAGILRTLPANPL